MVTITDASLRHNLFETVYDLISIASSSYGASSTPKLSAGYPKDKDVSYPMIVVMSPLVDESDFTLDRTSSLRNITVPIMVFTKRGDDLDLICDGVSATVKLGPYNGAFVVGASEDFGVVEPAEQRIKLKTLSFQFVRR